MRKVCAQRYIEFGAAGQASTIRVKHTSVMAKLYTSGALDPKIGLTKVAAE